MSNNDKKDSTDLSATIASYVEKGATYTDNFLSSVAYGTDDPNKQAVDIYFPKAVGHQHSVPVYVHIHGGGWSRGNKASPFYGGPSLCQNAVQQGWLAVSIGYRLGRYPHFMHDCADAMVWVRHHIAELGGNVTKMVLSGHSAGGHIASLLMLRHACFLEPKGIPLDFFSGLILVSGVYDLFNPLRAAPIDVKNKWFLLAYVLPAFGYNDKLRREASPLLLLNPRSKDTTTAMGTIGRALQRNLSGRISSGSGRNSVTDADIVDAMKSNESSAEGTSEQDTPVDSEKPRSLLDSLGRVVRNSLVQVTSASGSSNRDMTDNDTAEQETQDSPIQINTSHLPRTLLLNAALDMGLQENGELMAVELEKYIEVKHVLVQGTNHADICWHQRSTQEISAFLSEIAKQST